MADEELGFKAKAYRNNGTYGAPDWKEVKRIRDNTLDQTLGEWDASSRASNGEEEVLTTLIARSCSFTLLKGKTAEDLANFNALRDAAYNRTGIEMMFLSGPIGQSGVEGLRATFAVTQFSRGEQLREGQVYDVAVKPRPADNPAAWVTY